MKSPFGVGGSNHRVERLQIGILLRQIPEGAVHLKTNLKIRFRVMDVAKKGFVTPHVVVIDRLFQERDGAGDKKFPSLSSFAQLVQTKTGVKKSGAGVGGYTAQPLADTKCEGPPLFSHQMMKAKLKDFGAVLVAFVDSVQFRERLAGHAKLCVAAGGLQLPFELHGSLFSKSLAMGC